MLSWDDYYQEQVTKGRRPDITAQRQLFKQEAEAFNTAWGKAQREGHFFDGCWGNNSDEDLSDCED